MSECPNKSIKLVCQTIEIYFMHVQIKNTFAWVLSFNIDLQYMSIKPYFEPWYTILNTFRINNEQIGSHMSVAGFVCIIFILTLAAPPTQTFLIHCKNNNFVNFYRSINKLALTWHFTNTYVFYHLQRKRRKSCILHLVFFC